MPEMKVALTLNIGCEKCRQYGELFQARLLLGGRHYGERWSGVVNSEHRWYDVSRAKNTLEVNRVGREHCQRFAVLPLWEMQIRDSYIVAEHLPHTDPDAPILLVTTHVDPVHGDCITLIDGIHRVARAHNEKRETVVGFKFSLAFSETLRIDPHTAILDELIAEACSTGGRIIEVRGMPCVTGGRLRDSTPDDHPLRAEMVAEFRRGPTVVNLELPK